GFPGMGGMMGGPGGRGAGRSSSASQRWEHHFDDLPGSVGDFHKLVEKRGQEGWEFTSTVTLQATGRGIPGGPPAREVTQLVFKRPVRSTPRGESGAMMGMGMMPGGPGGMAPAGDAGGMVPPPGGGGRGGRGGSMPGMPGAGRMGPGGGPPSFP